MFKILGFMLGSAVSIAAIVMLLGVPEFHLSKLTDDSDRFDAAVEKLKEKREQTEKLVAAATEAARQVEVAAEIPNEETEADAAPEPEAEGEELPQDVEEPETDDPVEPAHTLPPDDIVADASWYAFWNPFRSEIAARGFVSQLEKVTGLDYRIVKVKAGVYQVAFAYEDDAERDLRLSQIQAATGLDLSGT